MEIKIKSKKSFDKNTMYQWDNRLSLWGESLARTKNRKEISKIKKHIKYLEKKIKEQKRTIMNEDKMLRYIESQGYPIEVVK